MLEVKEVRDWQQVDHVIAMAKLFQEENRPERTFVPDRIIATASRIFADAERLSMNSWIVYRDSKPIGFLVAWAQPTMYSNEVVAHQELMFIVKEYRSFTAFLRLIRAYESWARIIGACEIYTGVAVHEPQKAERISKLLEKVGYSKQGYLHMKGTH